MKALLMGFVLILPFWQNADSFDLDAELARLKIGDQAVDIDRLRGRFALTDAYRPYGTDAEKLERKLNEAIERGDYEEGLEVVEQILEINPLYPNGYLGAMICHDGLGHEAKMADYRAILKGFFESITNDEYCTNRSRPCAVLATYEEYFVVASMGLRFKSQALDKCDGVACDVLEVVDPETEEDLKLHFDISIPYKKLTELIDSKQ